jgi:hypothetical protein
MYKKLVGILVMTLLITTTVPVIGQTNEKVENIDKPLIGDNRGALYMQLPAYPNELWGWFWSDIDAGWGVYDEFWDVSGPICDVHWWGFGTIWNGTHWVNCGVEDLKFDISFNYSDGSVIPSDNACKYSDLSPSFIPTGMYYIGNRYFLEVYYFEVNLEPCCDLSEGWVSIVESSKPSDCQFGWVISPDGNKRSTAWNYTYNDYTGYNNFDASFVLTDGEPAIPDLECEGELRWEKVSPGTNVTGSIKIRNNGDPGSILHVKGDLSTVPEWGSWMFSHGAAILTVDDGWITINVTVIAPEEKGEYFGKLKAFNAQDSTDFCEINIYMNVPRFRAKYYTLQRLFERFPNAFPILRQLIGLI